MVCTIAFLCGLVLITRGGLFWLDVFDTYVASLSLFVVCFTECVAIAGVLGYDKFAQDYADASGYRLPRVLKPLICVVCPTLILVLLVLSLADLGGLPQSIAKYTDSNPAFQVTNVFLAVIPVLPTLVVAARPSILYWVLRRMPVHAKLPIIANDVLNSAPTNEEKLLDETKEETSANTPNSNDFREAAFDGVDPPSAPVLD